jgi:hypothetical protein
MPLLVTPQVVMRGSPTVPMAIRLQRDNHVPRGGGVVKDMGDDSGHG